MHAAFYDTLTFCLAHQAPFNGDRQAAIMFSMDLTYSWPEIKHNYPSPYWVVWSDDPQGYFGVFYLDQNGAPDEQVLNLIKSLVDQARQRL
jgi:hypothetical protein